MQSFSFSLKSALWTDLTVIKIAKYINKLPHKKKKKKKNHNNKQNKIDIKKI